MANKDSVSMLPETKKGNHEQIMDKIPQALSTLDQNVIQANTNHLQKSQGNGTYKYKNENDGG